MSLCTEAGFDETDRGTVALVVTEACTNALRHGGGGEVVLRLVSRGESTLLEAIALDRGRGMADIGRCLEDGYSSAGSAGTGLGAIYRLADSLDVYSLPGLGTALLVRCGTRRTASTTPAATLDVGAVCVRKPEEIECGDAWAIRGVGVKTRTLVVDGLGHGAGAATAARAALDAFADADGLTPVETIERLHTAMRATRGGGAAIAEIDHDRGMLRFAGVGNIAGVVYGEEASHHLTSYNGTLGHQSPRVRELAYAWTDQSLLLMHSDGIGTRWSLDQYPGLRDRPAALIAGVLYRDFARGSDDATVLALRRASRSP